MRKKIEVSVVREFLEDQLSDALGNLDALAFRRRVMRIEEPPDFHERTLTETLETTVKVMGASLAFLDGYEKS
jgi:hypothetical protein